MDKKYEKAMSQVRGALYGIAIGDALGAPVEGETALSIDRSYGVVTEMMDGPWFNLHAGETTDDTAMTLCVAAGILENHDHPIPAIGDRFIRWLHTDPKDVGRTCALAIGNYERLSSLRDDDEDAEKKWIAAAMAADAELGGRSGGNGALMRSIYPAFAYPDKHTAIEAAQRIGLMTHAAEESSEAIQIYVSIVHDILIRLPLIGAVYENIKNTRYDKLVDKPMEPTGYVVNTLACALWAILHANTFEETLVLAVNLGGDSDTIAAVAGGIAGAAYGWNKIPCRWVRSLDYPLQFLLDHFADAVFGSIMATGN